MKEIRGCLYQILDFYRFLLGQGVGEILKERYIDMRANMRNLLKPTSQGFDKGKVIL